MKKMDTDHKIAIVIGFIYGVFYLYAIGDLNVIAPSSWDAYISKLSIERAFTSRSVLMFEAVAVLEAGYVIWLVSPVNIFIASLLSSLLAANVHGALYLRKQAQVCRTSKSGLIFSALPALLAGGACCAPSLILLLGIPALGALSSLFGWLVPFSVLSLGLNRVWQNHKGAPKLYEKK